MVEPIRIPIRNPGMDSEKTNAPAVTAAAVTFPPHRHSQDEVVAALADFAGEDFLRFAASSGVGFRQLALPMDRYPTLNGFTEANAAYLEVASELGADAIRSALATAGLAPEDVDIIFATTVTGVVVPTVDARLAVELGMRPVTSIIARRPPA
ncbi:MAG TPA: hypothetical protein PKI77_09105, partial [Mycobacterium sp.]|nr:hypothetical protein [Mycobacterium sp.]